MSKLEPEYADAFNAWKAAPSPQTMGTLLKTTAPSLNRAMALHVNTTDPLMAGHARKMMANAFSRYDPQQSSLGTFITNQLQGLKRVSRKAQNVISVPERVALQRGHLMDAETTLTDKLGREPTTGELADFTGLSLRRIEKVRAYNPAIPEGFFSQIGTEEGGGLSPAVQRQHSGHRAAQLVYEDLDPTDRKILEWSLGLHGHRKRQNQQIAAALRLTPGAVSQRKQLIQQKLDEMAALLPF